MFPTDYDSGRFSLCSITVQLVSYRTFVSASLRLCDGGSAVGGARLELQGEGHNTFDTFWLSQAPVPLVNTSISCIQNKVLALKLIILFPEHSRL